MKADRLPDRDDHIKWYNAVLELAGIADRSYPVKGTFIWMPYGLRIMKSLVRRLDVIFQEHGIEEVAFPLLVPFEFAMQNDKWFTSFKDEAFYTSEKELILRPTGEPAMYPIFKTWIQKGMLPIRVYETVSSYRNESKTTHTLIRDREISYWHEIHTVHKTQEEAKNEALLHKSFYEYVWRDILSIPPICVSKPSYEVFAGSDSAFEFYTILPDGRLLENGSVNNLGQAYAKKFNLQYVDSENNKVYVWQVCTGNGARFISAMISIHGDNKGLVVPPKIAPILVVIIPIIKSGTKDKVEESARSLKEKLINAGFTTYLDDSEITPGEKFNIWELKGVPLRLEIGIKELDEHKCTIFRRDTNKKIQIAEGDIIETVRRILEQEIPENMFKKAGEFYSKKIKYFKALEEAKEWVISNGVVKANWCEAKECFDKIKMIAPSVEAIGTLTDERKEGACIICGKATDKLTLFSRTY
jgi:prolyl-tRNA synthetase